MLRSLFSLVVSLLLLTTGTTFAQDRTSMITQSYREAFGKVVTADEIKYWSGRTDWKSKADLVAMHRGYIKGNNAAAREIVTMSYRNALKRTPTTGEYDYWIPQITKNGTTSAELETIHSQYALKEQADKAAQEKAAEKARLEAEKNRDPWIAKAFQEVLGRAPKGSGISGEWDPKNYGNGKWSSYGDLVNKVRVKTTGQGIAYIFIKPEQAVYQGHIGWGFIMDDGRYCYGSTENPMKATGNVGQTTKAVWDALTIDAGQDNGYWHGYADTEKEMLDDMKRAGNSKTSSKQYPYGFRCSGYARYKSSLVLARNEQAAKNAGENCRKTGFKGVTWNCLDQTYSVLEAYGVDKQTVMPWKQDHPSPNYWFNDFGYIDAQTKKAYKGGNTSGYAL